jgi:O6-methylguanine-DNA--protein-cysteine methyltransferase
VVPIVLSLGTPLDMLLTGSIVVLGEMFRSSKYWELNRKKKVPNFEPKQKKKKKKVRRQTFVPEGVKKEKSVVPRISTVKEYFDLFWNKWKDKIDVITIKLVDIIMEYFDLWKNKWKDKVRFSRRKAISKVYFASEYLRRNYGSMKDYSSSAPELFKEKSVFQAVKSNNMPIVFDTGASTSLTSLRADLDGEL